MIDVASDLRSHARIRTMREVRGCPLPSSEQQRHVDDAIARITAETVRDAIAWSQRFVLEYECLLEEMQTHHEGEPEPDFAKIANARGRLEWWRKVAALGKYTCGWYDAVGTRDRLRGYLRGEFDDEIDACLVLFANESNSTELEKSA
jgi:hypothetical protein